MATIVHDIAEHLGRGESFSVINNNSTVAPHSYIDALRYRWDSTFHNECAGRLADLLISNLREAPRHTTIAASLADERTITVKTFLKQEKGSTDSRIELLKKEFLAFELCIPADAFDAPCNAGFMKFASSPPLKRYLFEYRDMLQLDPETHEILIRAGGTFTPWSQAKNIIAEAPRARLQQRWMYGPNGLQNENMYDWTELKPYKKGDPATWNYQYVFEFCVCCSDTPNQTGDHTWIRLKDPEGNIYSVGIYRPGKRDWTDNYKLPFRIKKGHLMQPDVSEFWPMDIFKIPVAITRDEFLQMKKALEDDKLHDDLTFQLFQGNCTLYAAKIASIAHIKLPTGKPAWHFIMPNIVISVVNTASEYIPEIILKVIRVCAACILNLIALVLGASVVDAAVSAVNPDQQAHIASFWDFFDYDKLVLHHPNTLGKETFARVSEWRQRQVQRLELQKEAAAEEEKAGIDAEIARVRLDLPADFRC